MAMRPAINDWEIRVNDAWTVPGHCVYTVAPKNGIIRVSIGVEPCVSLLAQS